MCVDVCARSRRGPRRARAWAGTADALQGPMRLAVAVLFGTILGLPFVARGGGDLCPHRVDHYDDLTLQLTAITVDGEAQPLPPSTMQGALLSDSSPPLADYDLATASLPDPLDPTRSRPVRLKRRH